MNRSQMLRLFSITISLSIFMLTACTLAPERNRFEEMSQQGAGYDQEQPRVLSNEPKTQFEQRVRAIPSVTDAHVLLYGADTLIVAVDSNGATHEEIIEDRVAQELQGETKDRLIYVVRDKEYPDLHAKVKALSNRMKQGRPVSDEALLKVVNDTWRVIVPINFGN